LHLRSSDLARTHAHTQVSQHSIHTHTHTDTHTHTHTPDLLKCFFISFMPHSEGIPQVRHSRKVHRPRPHTSHTHTPAHTHSLSDSYPKSQTSPCGHIQLGTLSETPRDDM